MNKHKHKHTKRLVRINKRHTRNKYANINKHIHTDKTKHRNKNKKTRHFSKYNDVKTNKIYINDKGEMSMGNIIPGLRNYFGR